MAFDGATTDDRLDLARVAVALSFGDLAGEEDAFEVKDREVVIFECFGGMDGYDIVQRSNELANASGGQLRHIGILADLAEGAQRLNSPACAASYAGPVE